MVILGIGVKGPPHLGRPGRAEPRRRRDGGHDVQSGAGPGAESGLSM